MPCLQGMTRWKYHLQAQQPQRLQQGIWGKGLGLVTCQVCDTNQTNFCRFFHCRCYGLALGGTELCSSRFMCSSPSPRTSWATLFGNVISWDQFTLGQGGH